MLLNFILLMIVFGASKKKLSPYASAVILGLAKGGIYFAVTLNPPVAILACLIFTGLAAGIVHFLARLDKKEATEDPYPTYGTRKKGAFKWEYVVVTLLVVLLLFGESLANLFIAQPPAS